MGLFDFLKKQVLNQESQIKINKDTQSTKTENNKADITSNSFRCNESNMHILGKTNDKYTKDQAIALFLKAMSYKPNSLGDKDSYPRYMTYGYNILDVPKFHKELIDEGYFCEANFEQTISDYRANELKELLTTNNQNVKGLKKEELINLALKVISEEEQQKIIKANQLFVISQQGLDYIEKYKEFLTVVSFKKYDINYSLYLEYKVKQPANSTIRDIAWHILNDRLNLCYINKQVGWVRSVYLHMAEFLEEEKPSVDVLYYYILCIYHDINLDHTQQQILDYKSKTYIDKKIILECIDKDPLAPGIISKINEYSAYHTENIFERIFNKQLLPYKFITDEEFKKMINDIYNSSFFDGKKYVTASAQNAKSIINEL